MRPGPGPFIGLAAVATAALSGTLVVQRSATHRRWRAALEEQPPIAAGR